LEALSEWLIPEKIGALRKKFQDCDDSSQLVRKLPQIRAVASLDPKTTE